MSESDLRTLREAIENGDVSKAIEFWRCWPMILETLVATGMDPETAKHETAEVYRVATGLLIGEAEKRGEDPKPIRLSVQAFHKIVLANRPFRDRDACSTITWPECLGAIEESLSGVLRDALAESAELIDRLKVDSQTGGGEAPVDRSKSGDDSRGHDKKLFPNGVPEDVDLVDLAVKLQTEMSAERSMNSIIREFVQKSGRRSFEAEYKRIQRARADETIYLDKWIPRRRGQ